MMRPIRERQDSLLSGGAGAADGRFPPRLSQLLRALFALLCGVLIHMALMAAFHDLAGIEVPPRRDGEKPVEIILCLAAAMVLAGYATGRISGKWGILPALGLGVLLSLGAGPADMQWQGIEDPLAQILSFLVLPPSAAFGGLAAGLVVRSEERRRAATPLQLPLAIRQLTVVVWLGFVLSLGMTAAVVWAVRLEGLSLVRILGLAVFGGGALLLGWQSFHNRPQAVLREDGIEFGVFRAVIPWSEIVDAVPSTTHPIEYVRLRVRNPERYLERLTPLQRLIGQAGESEPNIGFVLTGTPYKAEELCGLIRERVRREPE